MTEPSQKVGSVFKKQFINLRLRALKKSITIMSAQAEKSPLEVAINILLEAVEVAQKKGAYSLEESSIIFQQVKFLTTPPAEAPVEEVEAEEVK
jgi:tellurite resistance protein